MTVGELKDYIKNLPDDMLVKAVTEGLYRDRIINSVTKCDIYKIGKGKEFLGLKYE